MYFLARVLKDRRYLRRFHERLGFLPAAFQRRVAGAVWLHAVSVGEVLASVELVRQLRAGMPWAPVFVSVGTIAGRALAAQRLAGLAEGVFFAPLDYCFAVRRVLRTIRPSVVVVAETEIWPNLSGGQTRRMRLWHRGRADLRRRLHRATSRMALVSSAGARTAGPDSGPDGASRERYLALAPPAATTRDGGNLKYDFQPKTSGIPETVVGWMARTRPGEIWIAASTMPPAVEGDLDEDGVVLAAFRALAEKHPRLLLVLAPRRPERFDAAAARLEADGIAFVRRSRLAPDSPALRLPGVLLLDTIGELSSMFALPAVVFMGGSLAERGGHNILEPAFFGRPVIAGPHMENFAAIAAEFEAGGGLLRISGPEGLPGAVRHCLRTTRPPGGAANAPAGWQSPSAAPRRAPRRRSPPCTAAPCRRSGRRSRSSSCFGRWPGCGVSAPPGSAGARPRGRRAWRRRWSASEASAWAAAARRRSWYGWPRG